MNPSPIPVGILGATGAVGQRLVSLLQDHPWFSVQTLMASERSAGRSYGEATRWIQPTMLDENTAAMTVRPCGPDPECRLMFSALDASVAGDIERRCASAGHVVVSNARNHRMDPRVPLIIPEVNPEHLSLIDSPGGGMIVTNPNCSTIGLVLPLKPLHDAFGVQQLHVVTMQAISGAGIPGVSSMEILDNVVPFIPGEEEKIERETLKILGDYTNGSIDPAQIEISAQCTRVPVSDGHTKCVSVKLRESATEEDLRAVWDSFSGEPQQRKLPSAPVRPVHYIDDVDGPQPKKHRDLERGMAVSVGRLRPCPLFDFKFVVLSHNTIRGAAGGTIEVAELMVDRGLFDS